MNGDPYIGMLETPVTSAPIVAGYLSNLPAYRTGVSPLLRGVEIGLAHGLLVGGSCRRHVSGASPCYQPASACSNRFNTPSVHISAHWAPCAHGAPFHGIR